MTEFEGLGAIITGGASGIGLATARLLRVAAPPSRSWTARSPTRSRPSFPPLSRRT